MWNKKYLVIFVLVMIVGVTQVLNLRGNSPPHDKFYEELIENSSLFSGITHNGSVGALWAVYSEISSEGVLGLAQCFKENKRIIRGVGSSKGSEAKNIFIQLASEKTVYNFIVNWDKERSKAYVTQEERSTLRDAMSSLIVKPDDLGFLVNDCFVDSLSALKLDKL